MDYETKLILERLIEAINNNQVDLEQLVNAINNSNVDLEPLVKAVNSPDWWSIAATFFAAVVAAGITWHLGKRQNKLQQQQVEIQKRQNDLQEQQVKLQDKQNQLQKIQTDLMEQQIRAQEYEIYRSLYELMFSIHKASMGLVMKTYSKLASGGKIEVWTWEEIRKEIYDLKNRLESKVVDIDLKFPEDSYRCESCKLLLVLMEGAVNKLDSIEQQGFIESPNIEDVKTLMSNTNKGDSYMLSLIASYISDKSVSDDIVKRLITVSEASKIACDVHFLEKIKAKI